MRAYILRCQPSSTKNMMIWGKEQHISGLWTPFMERIRRLPRTRKRIKTFVPVLPGYLFIREDSPDLSRVLKEPQVRYLTGPQGGPATCSLAELVAMHEYLTQSPDILDTAEPEVQPPSFPVGTKVNVVAGSHLLSGMQGLVLLQEGEEVTLETSSIFGRLKISSFLLRPLGL